MGTRTITVERRNDWLLGLVVWFDAAVFAGGKPGLIEQLCDVPDSESTGAPDLIIDLTGNAVSEHGVAPVLSLEIAQDRELRAAAIELCIGKVPEVSLLLDGAVVDTAAPMTSSRNMVCPGLNDVLARAITLLVSALNRAQAASLVAFSCRRKSRPSSNGRRVPGLLIAYFGVALPCVLRRAALRVFCRDHWRVGYRFSDGPYVSTTKSLAGEAWKVLPDPGDRFYADPFPFEWKGQYYIFVEELQYRIGKGVISVSCLTENGSFSKPRTVIEEKYHLSYPQVFVHEGEVFMIPESGAGNKLCLYRARDFPYVWDEEAILIPDIELFDATLVRHSDMFWIIGSTRDGLGDTSDTMVAFFSESLRGPWIGHSKNPILIDKASGRPGGGFSRENGDLVLPVQDGTEGYGCALGIARISNLTQDEIRMSNPIAIDTSVADPEFARIHTINRCGRLETIDGLSRILRFTRKKSDSE